jgi:hypothetical protein
MGRAERAKRERREQKHAVETVREKLAKARAAGATATDPVQLTPGEEAALKASTAEIVARVVRLHTAAEGGDPKAVAKLEEAKRILREVERDHPGTLASAGVSPELRAALGLE